MRIFAEQGSGALIGTAGIDLLAGLDAREAGAKIVRYNCLVLGELLAMAQVSRLSLLEDSVKDLKDRLAAIEDTAILGSFTLHVETFAPEPYKVKRPVPISLQRRADGYIASFVEANVNSAGDTQQEALANVKELILDAFDSLSSLPPSKLGPGPARQLAVLREFIDVAPDHERARGQDREEAEGKGDQVP